MSQGSSNPTTNLIKINGVAVDVNAGNASTGTQRVVLATNQSVIPVSDNGGSLTVDGSVSATQSGAWNIGTVTSITNSVAVTGTFWQATQPVSGTVDLSATSLAALETINAAQSGTWDITNISGTVSLPTGASTSALQTTGNNLLTTIDADTGGILTAVQLLDDVVATDGVAALTKGYQIAGTDGTNAQIISTNTSGHINIADGGNSITVDGTVGISGSVAVTGTFWQATQPVSGTVAATQSGTWNIGTLTSITNPVAVTDNSGSLTVDAPVGTPVFVRLSDGTTAISTLPVSLASVPSHNVTNAGTFAVQAAQSGAWNIGTVTTLTGITNAVAVTDNNGSLTIDDGGSSITVDGTVGISGSVAVTGTFWQATQPVSGTVTATLASDDVHDGAAGTTVIMNGAYASSTAPTAVSANGDAVRLWATTSGALNIADGGSTISIDDGGGAITVDGTVAATQSGTWNIGTVTSITNSVAVTGTFWQATQPVSGTVAATQSGTWDIGTVTTLTGITNAVAVTDNNGSLTIDDGGSSITVDGTVGISGSVAVTGTFWQATQPVSGTVTATLAADDVHDGVAGTALVMTGAYASSTAPTAVVNGDAVRLWATTNGALNIADGGGSLTIDATSLPLPTGAATETTLLAVKTAVELIDNAISGTEMQVDVVASLPAGDNNIGNVDVVTLPSLPTGSNVIGAVTQSGTWTVTTTANDTHDGTAGTTGQMQVGYASTATPAAVSADGDAARFWLTRNGALNIADGGSTISIDDGGGAITVDGTVAATQSGTWSIRIAEQLGTATAISALNGTVSQALTGTNGASVTVTAISSPVGFVVTPYVSYDGGTNYSVSRFYDPITETVENTITNASLAVGLTKVILAADGATHVRVQATSWTSGSATFRLSATNSQGVINLKSNAVHDTSAGTYLQLIGAHASASAPTAVSADGDAVKLWATTSGALNIADGGSSISIDDGGNSITVDGTVAVSGTVTVGTHAVTQSGTWTVGLSASQTLGTVTTVSTVTNLSQLGGQAIAMGTGVRSAGTQRVTIATDDVVPASQSGTWNVGLNAGTNAIGKLSANDGVDIGDVTINNATLAVTQSGSWTVTTTANDTHDGAAGTTGQMQVGYASTATPAAVSADGDAARFWLTRNGALNIADGGGSITVDGTFWQATQPVSIAAPVAVTQSGTWNIGTVTSLTQFNGVAIALNAGTVSTGTLRVVNATGATGTQTNPSLSTTSATVLAASTSRLGATIYNGSTSTLYLRLSATAASTTVYTTKLYPDDYYEVPLGYNGAITGILDTGSTTLVQVTQIT